MGRNAGWLTLGLGILLVSQMAGVAQGPGTRDGEWTYLGGDAWHTRYTPADQIDASNFEDLEVAWRWDAASFGPSTSRATATYVDGRLITVSGDRRHVVALDPATGELVWSFTEPNTHRFEYSMRKGYLRQGRRVCRDRRTGCRVHLHTRLLPARAGRGDRRAAGELGSARAGRRIPADGHRGSRRGPDRGLGPMAGHGSVLRCEHGDPPGDRLHHELLAADRRQRRGGCGELGRAGLQPDAVGERSG